MVSVWRYPCIGLTLCVGVVLLANVVVVAGPSADALVTTPTIANKSKESDPYDPAPLNVIVIGGSSGMGKATAMEVIRRGGNALIVSRSEEKLKVAANEIRGCLVAAAADADDGGGGTVSTATLDVTDERAVQDFATKHLVESSMDYWDGLVVSAAGRAPHGPVATLPTDDTRQLMETKFWGAYLAAKYISPHLRHNGAICFVGGVLNRRPGINCAPLASTNGALEGLTRALALELGPRLRVNCLSPGFCDTERFDHMDPIRKQAMLTNTADSLPLKRVGQPQDMGQAIYYLLTSKFCTGVVLDCDGGHHIRQYANPSTDPMRNKK